MKERLIPWVSTALPEIWSLPWMYRRRQKHGFPCSAETDLFDAAILAHPEKIIVKRLLKSECLAGREPY